MPENNDESKKQAAREVIDILHEISILLNTDLDRTQLSLCVSLIENGVNPEALAYIYLTKYKNVMKDLRRQAQEANADPEARQA